MTALEAYRLRTAQRTDAMAQRDRQWEADWECYHFSVNRQDRKVTLRNIIQFGFSARDAIEMVQACEVEG